MSTRASIEDAGVGLRLDGRFLLTHRHATRFRWLAPWLQRVIAGVWNLVVDPLTRRWVAVGLGAVGVRSLMQFRPDALLVALFGVAVWMYWRLARMEVVG